MSDPKHTPGPWGYFQADDSGEEFVVDLLSDREQDEGALRPWAWLPIAKLDGAYEDPETEANAKLIAAAPRLAAALKAMVKREAAQQTLLMNYRLGKRPTERALDDLSETKGTPEEAHAALREAGVAE